MQKLTVDLKERSYDIHIGAALLGDADKYMNLDRKVLIVTDSGVPKEYSAAVAAKCREAKIFTFPAGEENKNLGTYESICKAILDFGMQRRDAVVAVGGGVCGDMAGFAAATYMRGIDFYNVPTTLLSQVDSSIGGKTAIDFMGVKNILGAFYQPKAVLIDTATLKTLDYRQFSAGCAEIIKEAITFSEELFTLIEKQGICYENIEHIIAEALKIKAYVVERDEREGGVRKALNFGHTFGHGIEALGELLHGECVGLGMIPMTEKSLRPRLISALKKAGLPTEFSLDTDRAFEFMKHDKKGVGASVDAIFCENIGEHTIKNVTIEELTRHIKNSIS